jgi:ubiquinone/menaquinone biosynthesis C-methylase UbiE
MEEKRQFEYEWRRRFERFAREHDQDYLVSGWSSAGLERRTSLFLDLLQRLSVKGQLSVLDLGCGAGTYVRLLRELGHHVVGMDYSMPSLKRAVEAEADSGKEASYVEADAYHLPFKSNSFDMVISIGVLQALDSCEGAIEEMVRVLRPSGCLILEFLNEFEVPYALGRLVSSRLFDRGRVRRYSIPWLKDALATRNMKLVECSSVYLAPRRLPWLNRLMARGGIISLLDKMPGFSRLSAHAFLVAFVSDRPIVRS